MHLNDVRVRALPHPQKGQRDYPDDAVRGLSIRVGIRTKTFMLVIKEGGRRRKVKLGQYPDLSLAEARENARDLLAQKRIAPQQVPQTTFHEALELFYATHHRLVRPKTASESRRHLERHFGHLAHRLLVDIHTRDLAPIIDKLIRTPAERRNAYIQIKTFLGWAVKRGHIDTSPADRLEAPKRVASRDRVLSDHELIQIWHHLPRNDYGVVLKLCILTGQRIGQLTALTSAQIDRERKILLWRSALMKSDKPHTIPATNTVLQHLEGHEKFRFSVRVWHKRRIDAASGVVGWTHHDLRRTFATKLAELRIAPHVIERLLAHTGGTISGIAAVYNRASYLLEMREALQKYETWLQTLLSTTGDANAGDLRDVHRIGA